MKLEDLLSNRKERLTFGLKPVFENAVEPGLKDRILRIAPHIDPATLDTISSDLKIAWEGFKENYQGRIRGLYRDEAQKLSEEFDDFLEGWLMNRGVLPGKRKVSSYIDDWKHEFEERAIISGNDAIEKGIYWALGVAFDTFVDSIFGGYDKAFGGGLDEAIDEGSLPESYNDLFDPIRSEIEQAALDFLAKNPNATTAEVWAVMDSAAIEAATRRIPDLLPKR